MSLLAESLYQYIESREEDEIAFLETIVNIDSGTYYKAGIDRLIEIFEERLDALGFNTEIIKLAERGNHLVARKKGRADRRLLLVGHCDTVFDTGAAAERPFHIKQGRAYGPGVADMKGGLAVMIYALDALKNEVTSVWNELNITVIINSDEEGFSRTSRPIIEREARKADAICVLEPAREGGEYVIQRKGTGTFFLKVTGISAHSGVQPEAGASAIHELFRKGVAVQALNDLSPGLTVNIGVVRGGTRPNVVADFAEAEIDVRIPSSDDGKRIDESLRAVASEPGIPGTRTELSGEIDWPPMEQTESSTELFELVQKAGAELGVQLRGIATGGASDGNYASQYAPTCDGMGPQGSRYHSPDEYIELPTLVERTKVLARFVTLWQAANQPISKA